MSSKGKENTINQPIYSGVFIKKVILENFLSFQRDEVDFSNTLKKDIPKFILIVGPNWSGKTSIFQAIKFALGSNERDDRYKKWADFIRNGQDHAMVEIHIQHLEDLIKLRRIVIRGQSPYFELQKKNEKSFKKIPAIEIQKLVEDLNINPDNQFAFVSQGKIDAIKNLKPGELCSFLEEGIGLKGLREEILQQKNNVTKLNIDFQSLVSKKNSLNISLELLEPKLGRLKKKQKLLEIKSGYTDELLWANKQKIQDNILILEKKIESVQIASTNIHQQIDKVENVIEEKHKKISQLDDTINQLSIKTGELNYGKKELIKKIQKWQQDKQDAKQDLDALTEKITEVSKVLKNYEKERESISKELKIIKIERKNLILHTDNLIIEQNDLIKKIKINQEILDEYNQLISKRKVFLKKIQANDENINNINHDINEIFQSFKDIEHKLEKNKWFLDNPSRDLLIELDTDLKKASNKIYDNNSQIEQLEREKSKKLQKLKILQSSLRERRVILPSNINVLKEEIKKRELKGKVKGPLIEYLKYDDELSYAIESVVGEKLLYSFIASDWDTLNLLNKLKNKYNAYCNIYLTKKLNIISLPKVTVNGVIGYLAELIKVIDNDIDIQKVIYSKVKNCLVVRDYNSGKDLYKKYNFKGKCVTLKGEQIVSYKYVYETPFIKRLKGLLSTGTQKEQSRILEEELSGLNEHISYLKVGLSKLDKQQQDLYNKKESFNDLLYNFNQKQRLTTKKNQLYQMIYELEQEIIENKHNITDLDNKINEVESKSEPEFFNWNNRLKEIPDELNKYNTDLKKRDKKLNENIDILNKVKDNLNSVRNQYNIIKKEFDVKKEDFQKADKKAFGIYRKLEDVESELRNTEKTISETNELKGNLQKERKEINNKLILLKLNFEKESIKLISLKQELTKDKRDLERVLTKIGPLVIEDLMGRSIEEINKDILSIDKELLKYYDVDQSILVEKEQIISSLKEITKNQTDLETDIKSAIKTENKMEETYYDKFKVVLSDLKNKINQKFKSANIKSYCSLELIGDFEDLGVDIKAATSKDQLKSCTALSGGQVSMVSICLILSLQEIEPSPLCMFDEAGMFLDDKNSEASYQMIKSTLEQNPIQLLMFLPTSLTNLYFLADKIIGVARVGKDEVSAIFKPKIIKKNK